ncbi:hypothetical protein NQ317_004844 [Molorchus minor]|uniref:Adenosine kinase n=1 Tax=Molorchus minor TaxID=1323400 RepID=A0ABQ9J2H7_9CUCU|nr:hypothetical protein NQ317_004844 [Molorchus minor]
MKTIVAFGNPLLDTTVFVDDNLLLNKYNLKEDGQKEITKEEMQRICKDISSYNQHQSAGGCAQNSLRVLQWLLKKQCNAFIFGSVGKDNDAVTLKNLLEKDGVQTRYIEQNLPTGKTVAIVKGPYRSLAAYIGAAEQLSISDLLASPDFNTLVLQSDFVYRQPKYILDFCNENNKKIIYNISGDYVCDICPDGVKYFAENADIVFGNKREFEALAKLMSLSLNELTKNLVGNKKYKLEYGKIIVITDGSKMVTCIEKEKIENFDVLPIEKNDIRDTTGAGDAFTGGFIAGLCMNKSIKECAQVGCYAAYHIIKQIGCTLPDFVSDILI